MHGECFKLDCSRDAGHCCRLIRSQTELEFEKLNLSVIEVILFDI